MISPKLFLLVTLFPCLLHCCGQGGPPMLTDDPGTPDKHGFEINTSINSEITHQYEFSVPLLDLNYGATVRMQLKAEMPYLVTIDENNNASGTFGRPNLGIKYRFLDEEKYHVAVSVFPQVVFTDQKEIILPAQFQKSVHRFTFGEAIGYDFVEKDSRSLLNGNLVGYKTSEQSEMMLEFYWEHQFSPIGQTGAWVNYGLHYFFSKHFTLLLSFGTQVITPSLEDRQYFISFLGLQTLL